MRRTTEEVRAAYPHLAFTDSGAQRLDAVLAFLGQLEATSPAFGERATTEFLSRLAYLNGYGGVVSEHDPRRRFRLELSKGLGPRDFDIVWTFLSARTQAYEYFANGGLIWHGGPEPSTSVSLEPDVLWGIHT